MSNLNPRFYITERTKMWRSREIKPWFVESIDVIEEFGCQLLTISNNERLAPSFTYSTGVYDTCGKPEIITTGLPSNVAGSALNDAIARMREGIDLTQGRHNNIIGNVEVEFHAVDPKWLHHLMLRTNWYYEGMDVPVLQLVYPDIENRFSDDPNFNPYFEQPTLSGPVEHGTTEYDLWSSHDEASSLFRWKFPDSPHTNAYLSQTVCDEAEPVAYVSHDADGDWQFLGDKMSDGGGPVLSCLHHPIDKDRSLEELHDLPLGWYATRNKPGEPWERFEHPHEDNDDDSSDIAPPLT